VESDCGPVGTEVGAAFLELFIFGVGPGCLAELRIEVVVPPFPALPGIAVVPVFGDDWPCLRSELGDEFDEHLVVLVGEFLLVASWTSTNFHESELRRLSIHKRACELSLVL
jgi:hypothetical protein